VTRKAKCQETKMFVIDLARLCCTVTCKAKSREARMSVKSLFAKAIRTHVHLALR
jgi:hypothetical protein